MSTATGNVEAVREHYDRLSHLYGALWGEHIHHGYWEADESPAEAQRNLTARLAERAGIRPGARVLDVGCGLGGSMLWLARELGCTALGITISPEQAERVARRIRKERGAAADVRVMDANRLDLPARSFDVVWVIECSEHLQDKARFLRSCANVLKPGGTLALCAWLAGPDDSPDSRRLREEICDAMLCPSLATIGEYRDWMRAAGFDEIEAEDITRHVERTWAHCVEIASRPSVRLLLRAFDERTRRFVAAFPAMQRAYADGAMSYGMFTARRAVP